MKKTFEAHEEKYETEVAWLKDLRAHHNLMQQMTTDTLAYALGAVASLEASSKNAQDKIRGMSGKHEEQILLETARSDGLKAEVTDLTGQVMTVEEILRISR